METVVQVYPIQNQSLTYIIKRVPGSGEFAIDNYGCSEQGKGYLNPDYQFTMLGPLPVSVYKLAY
jgi:hypothetical protein